MLFSSDKKMLDKKTDDEMRKDKMKISVHLHRLIYLSQVYFSCLKTLIIKPEQSH